MTDCHVTNNRWSAFLSLRALVLKCLRTWLCHLVMERLVLENRLHCQLCERGDISRRTNSCFHQSCPSLGDWGQPHTHSGSHKAGQD